jgi:hypothetical protein
MHKLEWPCRILLVINCLLSFLGYVAFIQAEHQLVSPIIPSSTVLQIARDSIYASLPAAVLLLISLGFYFYQKRMVVIILSSLAIISYYVLSNTNLI